MEIEIKISKQLNNETSKLSYYDEIIEFKLIGECYENINIAVDKVLKNIRGIEKTQIKIDGDCAFIVMYKGSTYVYITETSNFLLYSCIKNDNIVISDDYLNLIDCNVQLNLNAIALLLSRFPVFPFDNVKVFQTSKIYKVDKNIEIIYTNTLVDSKQYKKMDIEQLSDVAYNLIVDAVYKRVKDINETIGIAMSGGIDSVVLAYCLHKLGKQICCIHWISNQYDNFNEDEYALEFCNRYNIPLVKIDITADIDNYEDYFLFKDKMLYPYIHGGISWWDKTYNELYKREIKFIITGLNGDYIFGTWFKRIDNEHPDYLSDDFVLNYIEHQNSIPVYDVTTQKKYEDNVKEKVLCSSKENEYSNDVQRILPVQLQRESMRLFLGKKYGIKEIAPYIDLELMIFGNSISRYYKAIPYGGKIITKCILKNAFFEHIPFSIISRNSKSTFGMLSEKVLVNNYIGIMRDIEKYSKGLENMLDFNKIKKLFSNENLIKENKFIILDLLFICKWLNRVEEIYEVDYV